MVQRKMQLYVSFSAT